eukprot:g3179.t1
MWLRHNIKKVSAYNASAYDSGDMETVAKIEAFWKEENARPKRYQSTLDKARPLPWDAEQVLGTGLNHSKVFQEKYSKKDVALKGKPWRKSPEWLQVRTVRIEINNRKLPAQAPLRGLGMLR